MRRKHHFLRVLVFLSLITGTLSACAQIGPHNPRSEINSQESALRQEILTSAMAMIDTPYRYGGTTRRGFDCSGFVSYAYGQAGIRLPRTAQEQQRSATRIATADLKPGDMVFFKSGRRISHVGLYVGDGRMVHSPSKGDRVRVDQIHAGYWGKRYAGAGRVLVD